MLFRRATASAIYRGHHGLLSLLLLLAIWCSVSIGLSLVFAVCDVDTAADPDDDDAEVITTRC